MAKARKTSNFDLKIVRNRDRVKAQKRLSDLNVLGAKTAKGLGGGDYGIHERLGGRLQRFDRDSK